MRIIFLQDVPDLAQAGEIRTVADGHARNYLFPKGLAAPATKEQLKRTEHIKQAASARRGRETKQWEDVAEALTGTTITVKAKVSPSGQYYGAITATLIAQELSNVTGRDVDKKLVALETPIQEPGTYEVNLNLFTNITAPINVIADTEE